MRDGFLKTTLAIALTGVLVGCAASNQSTGSRAMTPADHQRAIQRYRGMLSSSPNQPELWRALGISYYQVDSLDQSMESFGQAGKLLPDDPPSVFYKAMIHERRGNLAEAAKCYRQYLSLKGDSRLQAEARRRIRWIEDEHLKKVVTDAIANEKNVGNEKLGGNTAAVVRFDASSLPQNYRPLGRAIAELIYADLSHVSKLTLVERLELSALQKELALSQTEFADKFNSPRIGRIVGASKVITGQLISKPDNGVQLEAGIIDVGPGLAAYPDSREGKVSDIVKMQKQLSLDIISKLGYEITPEIRNAIAKPATESMLALIAYSRGLDYADRGMYSLAEAEFKAALNEDVNFGLAKDALQEFGGISDYDGKLKPLGEVAALANTEITNNEQTQLDRSALIGRLQESTKGTVPAEDKPYVAPRSGSGSVIVRGRTD